MTKNSLNHLKTALCLLPPLLLAVFFYLHFETQVSIFSPICRCATTAEADVVDRLRASATFLPLKDTRQGAETWFISTLNATSDPDGEARNLVFPSASSAGRLLCLAAPSRRDGTKNSYALAWRDALPRGAALLSGLAFVSETAYDHVNIWHGLSSFVPFASWHERGRCRARPARWALFHHGEVRTATSAWLATLAEATTGVKVAIETFDRPGPVCLEEAVVFRANVAGMNNERLLRAADFMRCKARAHCRVAGTPDPSALRVTLLFRRGGRAFKDEAAVERVFRKECARVAGCRVTAAHADGNMTFCDQVRLLSGTDVLVSAHGAQMTNLLFMDRNSSVMELYPMGWKERAGGGQYVFRWMAGWAGMRHEGSWWDDTTDVEPCPDSPDIYSCWKNRRIGHDEAYFATWAARVFAAAKERKATGAAGERGRDAKICQCGK
ncbi:hypothetical protein PR202_ga15581 [Eleusine coracana subsp. coracana]|uniref:Glycosyltransferase 61 catalytic domain-containing protein n=1 Tax=Eleusine coracana subsp. coracana TaxID=191504 RepID=A0AAV5CJD7_ELECO|nr:hypothetical protein QOZ80_6BG0491390 [Eleusine coracana subsp. coracana]GJM98557.1 hypothetical protein PR202_ga15581 [Eleusine coracana subsp. coracana]